ncbi:MFS transporter [Massilia sp. TS11]|uniref:MFS transporter n=1 Tax=Massilia sp. TS11 TaxID=2908003 RepID=UPI001EDC2AD9|nr:MFS transporter [Massilia sp. TS11]MCG2585923.1 MFS transporter [Massilia sp. TS11]
MTQHPYLLTATACLLALLSTVGAALPYPILPPLFAADAANSLNHFLGLPPKLLFGIALTINPIGLLIGSAVIGPLSDRYGRRQILLGTALGAAAGHALTAFALVLQSYPLFVLARFVTGLLEGNGSVARALLADQLDGSLRSRAFAWLNGAFYLGWLAGPLLAGLTLGFGITVPFWCAVVALVLLAGLVAWVLPAAESAGKSGPSWWDVARQQHALNLLQHSSLRTLFIAQLAYFCGVTGFYEFYPLWLVEVGGFDARAIAWATAMMCAVMTLTSALLAGRESRTAPLRRAAWMAFLVTAAVLAVAGGNLLIGLCAIAAFGVPHALFNGVVPAWSSERFGMHGQGAVMGLLSFCFCLANILMALAGSVLTLLDTRLILAAGAVLTAWSGWRFLRWDAELQAERVPV